MLREELRIKDARLGRIAPANRPHYPPTERLAILALKVARGWNNVQTGRALLLTDVTIASWLKRIDESGSGALVTLPEPVNRYPDFVRQVVRQLKCVCPTMGKVRIAQMLARAGLQLSPSTVRRFLRQPMGPKPKSGEKVLASAPPPQAQPTATVRSSCLYCLGSVNGSIGVCVAVPSVPDPQSRQNPRAAFATAPFCTRSPKTRCCCHPSLLQCRCSRDYLCYCLSRPRCNRGTRSMCHLRQRHRMLCHWDSCNCTDGPCPG